uniref:MARVEL domain-containing protein n=1 Tax=Corethron hystrix TaxID=216773 RepID=A0A7S1FPF3_9STRA|mmetsp:Transcript_20531/g.46589  ORF Transcript_20531/g.46589 Transcript_20531/m.46589 type:complete len:179 (+) Transcript_20531:76-612(+)
MDISDNKQQCLSKRLCVVIMRDVLVGSLVIIFIYAIIVQANDTSGIVLWSIFYALHALLCALALISYHVDSIKNKSKCILLPISVALIIWSLIQIIVVYTQLGRADDTEEKGGDNPSATDREEKIYELIGAIFGLVVASVHSFVSMKCSHVKSHRQENDTKTTMKMSNAFTSSNTNLD